MRAAARSGRIRLANRRTKARRPSPRHRADKEKSVLATPAVIETVYKSSFRGTPTFFKNSLCSYRRMEEIKEILVLLIVLVVLIAVTRRDRNRD